MAAAASVCPLSRSPDPLVDLLAQLLHLPKFEAYLIAQRTYAGACGETNRRENGTLTFSAQASTGLLAPLTVNGAAAGAGQLHQPFLNKLVLTKEGRVYVVHEVSQ